MPAGLRLLSLFLGRHPADPSDAPSACIDPGLRDQVAHSSEAKSDTDRHFAAGLQAVPWDHRVGGFHLAVRPEANSTYNRIELEQSAGRAQSSRIFFDSFGTTRIASTQQDWRSLEPRPPANVKIFGGVTM